MFSDAFAHVKKRFSQVVGDLGCEGHSCEGNSCDSVEVFGSYVVCDVFGVEVADVSVGVWEAGYYSEVYVVGALFAA